MSGFTACVVITTTNSQASAQRLAQAVINAGLAACVQIQPVRSYYQWQGKIETDDEFRLDIKTLSSVFEPLRTLIAQLHDYETPEIIMTAITGASPGYLDWLSKSIATPSADNCLDT